MFSLTHDLRAFGRAWFLGFAFVVAAAPVAAGEVIGAIPSQLPTAAIAETPARCNGRCGNGGCGKPGCPAQCPVRPDRFGFYGTQWRVWPGQGVTRASFDASATPVQPPKLEVPSAEEESPVSRSELVPNDKPVDEEPVAETLPPARSPAKSTDDEMDSPLKDEAAAEPEGRQREAEEPAPRKQPAPAAEPEIEKPSPPAAQENLFDEASHRRRRNELLASFQQATFRAELARQEAIRQRVRQAQRGAEPSPPEKHEASSPSDIRMVAHEEPAVPSEKPPRVNPLR